MANYHKLANRPRIARLAAVEPLVAASLDGPDAKLDAITRLGKLSAALAVEHAVTDALEHRLSLRPVIATLDTLQDLVRAARRKLERERITGRRAWRDQRLDAVTRLRVVLGP